MITMKVQIDSTTKAIYHYILRTFASTGRPPSIEETAAAFGLPDATAADRHFGIIETIGGLYRHAASREILSAYPFSAVPTNHHVELGTNRSVYAMCAIDALGIPFMLDTDAVIHSTCAQCSTNLSLRVSDGRLSEVVPNEMVVIYASPPSNCCAATNQCPFINFFCTAAHAQAWQAAHPEVISRVMATGEALEHGRQVFANLLR